MLAGLTILGINGIVFKAGMGEIEDFAVEIATKDISIAEITKWLDLRCK